MKDGGRKERVQRWKGFCPLCVWCVVCVLCEVYT